MDLDLTGFSALVRVATRDDMEAVARIYGDAVRDGTASFEVVEPGAEGMAERFDRLVVEGYPYFVAESEGDVVGFAFAGPYRMRPAYRHTVEDAVYVDPEFHGMGLGRLLLESVIEKSEALGFRQMIAVVGDSKNSGSINLHRSLGFQFAGVLHSVGFKHGRWLDSVFMQLELGEGDGSDPAI